MKPRLLLLIGILMIINTCLAGVPKVLMIKRQLASSDGSVINGDTTIAICVYDVGCSGSDCPDACTGSPIVCDTQVVTVSGGYFYFKLDLSSVDDSYLSDTLYLMVSVKNGGSYENLCPRETLYATHTYALSSHIADKSYNSDSLGGHPPSYYLDNTIDTFIAQWDSIRNMPACFADGTDDIGNDNADDLSDNVLNDLSDVNANPTDGQVLKYDAETGKWVAANDSVGSGGGGSGLWADSNTYITTIYSNRGIFRYGSICNSTEGGTTHVNLGYNSETGTSGQNNEFCTVGGGYENKAYKIGCTVAGGYNNRADGNYTFVGGGKDNYAHSTPGVGATICGGVANEVNDDVSTVCGGAYNYATTHGFVGGGMYNKVQARRGAICGGGQNVVYDKYGFIGGGELNKTYGEHSVVAGGYMNEAHGDKSAILGGQQNKTYGTFSFAFGYQAEDNNINNVFTVYWSNGGCVFIETPKDDITLAKRDSNSLYVTGNATITNKINAKHLHGGSNHWKVKSISASEQIDDSTTVYLCNASSDIVTLTLTTPSNNTNRLIVVKKIDNSSNKVTIDAGSSTIDGSQTYDLTTQYQSVILICDGTKWYIIADK